MNNNNQKTVGLIYFINRVALLLFICVLVFLFIRVIVTKKPSNEFENVRIENENPQYSISIQPSL
jgi:type IV secretory pathway VirB3-like protein